MLGNFRASHRSRKLLLTKPKLIKIVLVRGVESVTVYACNDSILLHIQPAHTSLYILIIIKETHSESARARPVTFIRSAGFEPATPFRNAIIFLTHIIYHLYSRIAGQILQYGWKAVRHKEVFIFTVRRDTQSLLV